MKKNFRNRLTGLIEGIADHIRGFVLALITIIGILGILVGYKYYKHTQEDPEFCMSCHMMKDMFLEWQRSKHRDVVCQKCHHLTLLEQNQLLVTYVVRGQGKFSQTHGRQKPWLECRECHFSQIAQGSVTAQKSFGHARHLFIQNIECRLCHGKNPHSFTPDEESCKGCHKNEVIHGIGMESFSCLKCHSFSERSPSMVSNERCMKCHTFSMKGPMADFKCYQCHKPHKNIKLKSSDCLGQCHGNESKVGQHGVHMGKGLQCLHCHKAHTWVVGVAQGRVLCARCHSYRDPRTFIN